MSSPLQRLAGAALIVLGGYAMSRVLGLIRNVVVLGQYGTSREYEVYIAAIQVPDLLFQVLAGGAVAAAFLPAFTSSWHQDRHQAWRLASSAINLGLLSVGLVALVTFFLSRSLTEVLVPGWDAPSKDLTASLMRGMLLSPVLFAASALCTSVLNGFHRFALAAAAPLAYNLSIILAALILRDQLGIHALAVGVVAGAMLHLLVQIPGLAQVGMRYLPIIDLGLPSLHTVLRLMLPRMFGLAVAQLNLVINVFLASFLITGSVGYLNVAWTLLMGPLAVAMAISTAVFPSLAEARASNQGAEVRRVFQMSLRMILFVAIPSSIGLLVLAEPLVQLFFERGAFSQLATERTAYALVFYSLGLTGHAVVEISGRLYYSLQDTRTPVLIACCAMAVNLGLGVLLMLTPLNYGGLALANSVAAVGEAALGLHILRRRMPEVLPEGLLWVLARLAAASLLMGVVVSYLRYGATLVAPSLDPVSQLAMLMLLVGAGVSTYLGIARLIRCEELQMLRLLVARS